MKTRILLVSIVMVLASGQLGSTQPSPSFSAGAADRIALDNWFAELTGPFRAGAEFWAANRSNSKDAACKGNGSWLAGCQAAQQRFAGPDALRKAEPDYRSGWNTAPRPAETSTRPLESQPLRSAGSEVMSVKRQGPWLSWVLAACAITGLFILGRAGIALAHRRAGLAAALAEVNAQAGRLHVRKIQLTQPDYYGTINPGPWEKEKQVFIKTRILPIFSRGGFTDISARLIPAILRAIDVAADREIAPHSGGKFSNPKIFDKAMSPIDYELYCALQLQKAGWKTKSTPRTGDQGADVIAERAGVSLVAQCKLYSSSVGNGAVQEVASAKQYYRTDLAIVVSNAPFTRSARQLAGVLGIKLMYHDELRSFTH